MIRLMYLFLILIFLVSCSKKIELGMTYDDVKSKMGSPSVITKGFTDLVRKKYSVEIENKGQFNYVTWEYFDKNKYDTVYINKYLEKFDNLLPEIKYDSTMFFDWSGVRNGYGEYVSKTYGPRYYKGVREKKRLDSLIKFSSPQKTSESFKIFIIKSVWCILFESTSGRVTNQGFFPISLHEE
jgi:hypothetical protein